MVIMVIDRSASTMRRFKMVQKQLKHTMLLSIHKEITDKLDLTDIANMFGERNNEKQRFFGVSCKEKSKLAITLL